MLPADRRRLLLATMITIVALPALWLMQRDNAGPGNPSVAAVGAPAPAAEDGEASGDGESAAPAYLEGPSSPSDPAVSTAPQIATGAERPENHLTGTASYKRFDPALFPAGSCQVQTAPFGATLTIRNVDNDRTTTCRNVSTAPGPRGEIAVVDTAAFLQIADLVDAPLPVEITW